MNALGNLGQMYLFILLILLVAGSGFAVWGFIDNMARKMEKAKAKREAEFKKTLENSPDNVSAAVTAVNVAQGSIPQSSWMKLILFSFIGVLLSLSLLGFLSTTGTKTGSNQLSQSQLQMQQLHQQINQMQQQLNNMQK